MASDDEMHGPLPSGSGTFQVRVTVVPISDSDGVYVAAALFLFGLNVPLPPIQLPPVAAVPESVTAVTPQTALSIPAFATAALFIVIVIPSEDAEQGPVPSGSGISQVRVTIVPISETVG